MTALLWRLASPYDAYVAHVVRLEEAIGRIRYFTDVALAYEAGLFSSVRMVPGGEDSEARVVRFRERVGAAAARMSDEEFEEFLAHLGGGEVAAVEADRARVVSRISHTTRGLEEYFAEAARLLLLLERRGYNPGRPDVAHQLRQNQLVPRETGVYRQMLHELGAKVGKAPGQGLRA